MDLSEKLMGIESQRSALLAYANETTGESDTRLGEAVRRLAEGYGQGSGDDTLDRLISREITEVRSNVIYINSYVFYNCTILTTADFPLAISIGDRAFYNCPKLTTTNFPLATSIGSYAFYNCSNLTTIDFPLATSIGDHTFHSCSSLKTLILRNTTKICTYAASSSSYDPKNVNLKIYVPRALLESYKTATNWKRLADKFVALEDYTVDGTTTGELDPTKTR